MEAKEDQLEVSDNYSLRGRVFGIIRQNILSGAYQHNEELREMTLARELGVSRTPVREALRQLELEGLVKIIPNKGAYVVGITRKDIRDIYAMRGVLEGLCVKWACSRITQEELSVLEEINDLTEFHIRKKRYDKVVELDNQFHQMLYQIADSRMLSRTLREFHEYLESARKITLSEEHRVSDSLEEHRAIVSALKQRDGEKAEALAALHMQKTIENMEHVHVI